MRKREGMTHGNQIGGTLGRLHAGEASHFQRVPFGVGWQHFKHGCGEYYKCGRGSRAPGRRFGADIDHAGVAG